MLSCFLFCFYQELHHQQPRVSRAAQSFLSWSGICSWNGQTARHFSQWWLHSRWQMPTFSGHDSEASDSTFHWKRTDVWHWFLLQLWDGAAALSGSETGICSVWGFLSDIDVLFFKRMISSRKNITLIISSVWTPWESNNLHVNHLTTFSTHLDGVLSATEICWSDEVHTPFVSSNQYLRDSPSVKNNLFQIGLMVDTIELYSLIWYQFEWTWSLLKVTAAGESKTFCAHFLTLLSIELDKIMCVQLHSGLL